MANWNNPLLSSTYTNFLSEVKARDDDAVTLNHAGTATNLPTNAKKWVSASSKFQNWNGSSFDDLVLSVSGGGTGLSTLATSRIPYGNGTGALSSDGNFVFNSGALGVGTGSPSVLGHFYTSQNATTEVKVDNPNTTDTNSRAKLSVIAGNATAAINAIHNDSVSFGSNTATKVNLYYNTSAVLSLESATSALVASSATLQSGGLAGNSPAFYGYRNSSSDQAAFFRQDGSCDIVRFDKSGTQVAFIDTNGNLGIGSGLGTASAKLHAQASSGSQLRLAYNASNYTNLDVSSAGNLYLNPSGGYTVQKAPNAALADGSLSASNIVFYLNEAGNLLTVKAKYADGTTVKTGTIALA